MQNKHLFLRGVLWLICIYHVLAGLVVNISSDAVSWVARNLAGMTLTPDPQFYYLAKPFGVYAMAFGVAMGVAAWNPVKNRAIITIGVILFALRIIQRLTSTAEIQQLFGVSAGRNWMTIAIVAVLGITLAVLRLKLYSEMRRGEHKESLY
jgi:DMSO/TMAO reductase YedYZ heme-binding membrane subunit